ncbi:unnamed protein product [Closterium sp. Naga37s-1]|nr:unnamed protein product [Closterium sp. Naga37s-1]
MGRPPKKTAVLPKSNTAELLAKGHQSEPATRKPLLKETVGPFADDTRLSLEKKLASLSFKNLEDNASGEASNAEGGKGKEAELEAPAADPRPASVEEEDEDEEEDDGFLSDDPEERLDPVRAGEIAALAGYTLTLLVPKKFVDEVPRTIDTVKELLVIWRKALTAHAQTSTKLQKRGRPPYLSGAAFHRVVDPVTGTHTHKIKGLVKTHPGDKYRWTLTAVSIPP